MSETNDVERMVICSKSIKKCEKISCPHAVKHYPHKPRETDWDGEFYCTEIEYCDGLNGKGRNIMCQCVDAI